MCFAQRAVEVRREVPALLEQLPVRAARCIADLLEQVRELEAKIAAFERELEAHARHSALAQRAQARQGIGPRERRGYHRAYTGQTGSIHSGLAPVGAGDRNTASIIS